MIYDKYNMTVEMPLKLGKTKLIKERKLNNDSQRLQNS